MLLQDFKILESLYTVMQKHLCTTLAHYLAFLGNKLGLPITRTVERTLIESAHTRWNKTGSFFWNLEAEIALESSTVSDGQSCISQNSDEIIRPQCGHPTSGNMMEDHQTSFQVHYHQKSESVREYALRSYPKHTDRHTYLCESIPIPRRKAHLSPP